MIKETIVAGILAGTVALGALVTYDGGAIVKKATETIAQQAEQLGIYETQQTRLANKINTLKVELADLKLNGTEADQAQIDSLTTEIETLEANIDTAGGEIADRITALEGEVNKANEDAALLDAAVTDAGEIELAMTESQMDRLLDEVPTGYALLKMIAETPQYVVSQTTGMATQLVIDKTIGDINTAHLNLQNQHATANFTVTLEGQEPKVIAPGETIDFGLVRNLDGKTVTILDAFKAEVGKYYLIAE
jgi:hypothetical protein